MQNFSDITAVILAGGLGTRIRSVVHDHPKVLAEIFNCPFLTFLLEQLVNSGIQKVVLCTGHLADKVYEKYKDKYKSLRIVHSREKKPLGTGGALRFALPHITSEYILVMNGDSFVDLDLAVYLGKFFKKRCKSSLLLVNVPDTSRYGKVEITKDGYITAFVEKGESCGAGWINAGIYILKKSIVATIPEGKAFSIEQEFFPKLVEKGLCGFCIENKFIDIGTPETYLSAEEFFSEIYKKVFI
jgi:NDP-sugar pyrophosphorylase family protein